MAAAELQQVGKHLTRKKLAGIRSRCPWKDDIQILVIRLIDDIQHIGIAAQEFTQAVLHALYLIAGNDMGITDVTVDKYGLLPQTGKAFCEPEGDRGLPLMNQRAGDRNYLDIISGELKVSPQGIDSLICLKRQLTDLHAGFPNLSGITSPLCNAAAESICSGHILWHVNVLLIVQIIIITDYSSVFY